MVADVDTQLDFPKRGILKPFVFESVVKITSSQSPSLSILWTGKTRLGFRELTRACMESLIFAARSL